MLKIDQTVEGDVLTLALGGQLNADGALLLGEILTGWQSEPGRNVIIDLHHISYVGSSGLKTLMHHTAMARNGGGWLVLTAVNDPVFQVFDIGGCARALTFAPSRDEALRLITGEAPVAVD